MDITITGKNLEVPDKVESHIEKKLAKLANHLPADSQFLVEISQEQTRSPDDRFVVQVTATSAGALLRGESRAVNVLTAVDEVAKVMDRQAERFKGRLYDKRNKGTSVRRLPQALETPFIARVKRHQVEPLTPEEAVEQMEMLGHSFFLFLNTDDGRVNLIYRRQDGTYGLIEPVLP